MSYSLIDYQGILGIEEAYNTLREEQTAVLAIYRDIRTLIHPDYSDDQNAKEAFKNK
jgi:hypothetical protein